MLKRIQRRALIGTARLEILGRCARIGDAKRPHGANAGNDDLSIGRSTRKVAEHIRLCKHQRTIGATKPERVGDGRVHVTTGCFGNVRKCALGIRDGKATRWRDHVAGNRERRNGGLDSTCCTERVADLAFG